MDNYGKLKEGFLSAECNLPYSVINIALPINCDELKAQMQKYKKLNIPCVLPKISCGDRELSSVSVNIAYETIFEIADELGIGVLFHLESAFENITVDGECSQSSISSARNLRMHTYRCIDREKVSYTVHSGSLMSIVAYDGNDGIVDLRPFLSGRVLTWQAPAGKWDILEFCCVPEEECGRINYLDYEISLDYISEAAAELASIDRNSIPHALSGIKFSDVGFITKNRRMWTEGFNDRFFELYRFDPAPYYPALFFDIGKDTARLKAQLFDCRARMLAEGFIKAAHDFANMLGIECISGFLPTKFPACSALTGDNLLINASSPCAFLNRSYLYGINSVKIAAGASYNFGRSTVNCDIFDDYDEFDPEIATKESMNVFARGANRLILHTPAVSPTADPCITEPSKAEAEYLRFCSRIQTVLKHGSHVSDIAVLYPIHSIHSGVYFYDYNVVGFEYPDASNTIDYMNVINSISFYSGHDVTVLHPLVLENSCDASDGLLRMNNGRSTEGYSILVIPSSEVISIKALEKAKEFFDCGGKIIATGALPRHALESTPENDLDKRVCELVSEIFGKDAANINVMREYAENRNEKGGISYVLYFSATAADGTNMADSNLIRRALDSFGIPYDITIPSMPKYRSTGALNTSYPVFKKLGFSHRLPNGGMINHIHKRQGEIDIYYVSNTTSVILNSPIMLRGEMDIEKWDPHTGSIESVKAVTVTEKRGKKQSVFTSFEIELEAARSAIFVGYPKK